MNKVMFLIALISMTTGLFAEQTSFDTDTSVINEPDGTLYYVHAVNGLKLRVAPSVQASTYKVLDYGTPVKKIKEETGLFSVGYTEGRWVKIQYNGMEGYIFDGFVSKLPVPGHDVIGADWNQSLQKYAHTNFDHTSTKKLDPEGERDGYYSARYVSTFGEGVSLALDQNEFHESVRLEIPSIRIMDAWHVVRNLLLYHDYPIENVIFKNDRSDSLYEISDRHREDVIIKKLKNGSILIEMKIYFSCG